MWPLGSLEVSLPSSACFLSVIPDGWKSAGFTETASEGHSEEKFCFSWC